MTLRRRALPSEKRMTTKVVLTCTDSLVRAVNFRGGASDSAQQSGSSATEARVSGGHEVVGSTPTYPTIWRENPAGPGRALKAMGACNSAWGSSPPPSARSRVEELGLRMAIVGPSFEHSLRVGCQPEVGGERRLPGRWSVE